MGVRIPTDNTYVDQGEIYAQIGGEEGEGFVLEHGAIKAVVLDKTAAALTADQGFVLIDLSDTTNFPHKNHTGKIRLYGYDLHVEGDTNATGLIHIGVIREVDATNGSTTWLKTHRIYADTDGTDSTKHWDYVVRMPGLDLEVNGATDLLVNVLGNAGHSGDVTWQTDVSLDSPRGVASVAPQDGDLVLYLDWTAGNLYFSITVYYRAEDA